MKLQIDLRMAALAAMLCIPSVLVLCGCGSNDIIKEDPKVAAARMASAQSLRSYFDKSNGSFDSLSGADKSAVIAICGSEANARTAFNHMVPNSPATSGGRAASGQLDHNSPESLRR